MKLVSSLVISLAVSAFGQDVSTRPNTAISGLAHKLDQWFHNTDPTKNTVYSPMSLYNVLAALYFGVNEDSPTRTELQNAFDFKKDFDPKNYAKTLGDKSDNPVLDAYNSYVFHKGKIGDTYKEELEILKFKNKKFDDFTGKEPELNEIVEKDTDEKITDMFPEGSFDGLTELVLLNTILFKGKWDPKFLEFDKSKTKEENIWTLGTESNSKKFPAEFMHAEKCKVQVAEFNRTLFLRLRFEPIRGKLAYFTIVMPKAGAKNIGIEAHHQKFSEIPWNQMRRAQANLWMPKYEVDSDLDLISFMKSDDINTTRLFSSETADLDRMFEKNLGAWVSSFQQKATVKVNEDGAEAAAATAVQIQSRTFAPKFRTYKINKPFKFFIHTLKSDKQMKNAKTAEGQKQGGTLFFSGVVNCPMNNCN